MLTFIKGDKRAVGRSVMTKRIAECIAKEKKCVLIVPEQQTVTAEKELASQLSPNAPLYFEVTNFTRFANSVFRQLGGIQKKYADKVVKSLIMWQTLTELSPFLTVTKARKDISAGLVERTLGAIAEAEGLGLDAKALAALSESEAVDKRLASKLSDLSKILSLYKSNVYKEFADSADDCLFLAKKLSDNQSYLCDTEIFIEGFTSFTVPQYTLLSEMIRQADVYVYLDIPSYAKDAFEYTELAVTKKKLTAICNRNEVDIKLEKEEKENDDGTPISLIVPLLWKSNRKIDNFSLQTGEEVRIFEAKTPYEECEFIASDIRRRVTEGASYNDFAIVAASVSDYEGILDTGLDKAGIKHFSSGGSDLMNFEAVKLVFAALAATRSFAREDVLAYAACGLSGISFDERDEFEMYVDKWQISGKRFTDGLVWNMNPRGFDNKKLPDHDATLARIDATRVKLLTPLMHLSANVCAAATVKEHAKALVSFLEEIELEKSLYERSKKLGDIGEHAAADYNLRLYSIICAALDTMVEAIGDAPTDKDAFSSQLRTVFSASEIGRIPSSADEVMIGSADTVRLGEKKHVYLIGVNYGKFPAPDSGGGFFTDKEKKLLISDGEKNLLHSAQIDDDADEKIRSARGLYSFTRAFSSATETVTLTYPKSDASFSELMPSFVITNISSLTSGAVKPVKIEDLAPLDKFYAVGIACESINECSSSQKAALKEALQKSGALVFSAEDAIDNGSLECSPTASKEINLTQTKIDAFIKCPLNYFCKYTLSLSENERAKFGSNNIGSYIHAVLENFFLEVKREKIDLKTLEETKKEEMIKRAAAIYLNEFSEELGHGSERMRTALSKIYRAAKPVVDGLCEEFQVSKFEPAFFELPISKIYPNGASPLAITGEGGEKINIYGTIDRVDTYKNGDDVYVRVVDYKTGGKDFNPDKLKDGVNLQMFLYLKSIVENENEDFRDAIGVGEGGKILPAGAVYLETDISDQRVPHSSDELAKEEIRKAQARKGMILDDENIRNAMGKEYLPVKVNNDGSVNALYRKYLFTEDGWRDISKTVEDAVGRIGHRIASGDIRSANGREAKKNKACEYCAFKAFCRNMKL
ncbi:MAG: PD-(D/E)XK nuclease family protein [Clostridia bacterium]|nr:PD-(D/E)XK nuclease family protein [Clostridia bacterium]